MEQKETKEGRQTVQLITNRNKEPRTEKEMRKTEELYIKIHRSTN